MKRARDISTNLSAPKERTEREIIEFEKTVKKSVMPKDIKEMTNNEYLEWQESEDTVATLPDRN